MKIDIQNFQSIGKAQVDATGLTVVVGPSNRGKSALLRAVEGALFNKPGDGFVRVGAKTAVVSVELPTEVVTWEKGSGVNKFTRTSSAIRDGETYAKVGTKAPDFLQTLGFRDVVIGARTKADGSREGGETLRPQVSRQFGSDSVFLLDRPGTFVNEVLVRVSRLGVLQRAGRQCSLDLKQQRSLLKVRRDDLQVAEATQARLEPIVALRDRVAALRAAHTAWSARSAMVQRLALLVRERGIAAALAAQTVPEAGPRVSPMAEKLVALQALAGARATVVPMAAVTLPAPASRDLRAADRVVMLKTLVPQRRTLPPLPPERAVKKTTIAAIQKWQGLLPLIGQQRLGVIAVRSAELAVQDHDDAVTEVKSELAQLRTSLQFCPTCERPF